MNILTIPIRCTQQKWPRTLALIMVFLLGVASITALHKVSTAVGEGFEKKLTSFGANIIISPKRETLTVSYGGIPLGNMMLDEGRIPLGSTLSGIRGIALHERLAAVAPKLVGIVRFDGKHVPIVGVDFENELELKQFWNIIGSFPGGADSSTGRTPMTFTPNHSEHAANATQAPAVTSSSAATSANSAPVPSGSVPSFGHTQVSAENVETYVLAGSTLATQLGLKPGADLTLGDVALKVGGVLAPTGSDDDNVLFLTLSTAQKLLHAGMEASFIEVAALCAGCPIEDIVHQLQAALPTMEVKALRQVVEQRLYAVDFAKNLALLVALVILFTACAMVVMSMLSAVNERRKEIGILRAIGYSRGAIFFIFAAEALGIGLIAGLAGYCIGYVVGQYVLTGLNIDAAILPPFSWLEMLVCGLVAGCTAIAAATFPALKAGRVEPAAALAEL